MLQKQGISMRFSYALGMITLSATAFTPLSAASEKSTQVLPSNAPAKVTADLILTGGELYTGEGWVSAMAVSNGTIVAVGDANTVAPFKDATTKVVDLGGKAVLPGFHDMHIHPLMGGQMMTSCVLKREATPDEIKATVAACAAKKKPGEWITGGSWVNSVFKDKPQDKALLDEAAPNNPVVLIDETGHSSWVNSAALKLANITKSTANPLNGVIEHRPNGEPNGLLRESAAGLIRSIVPIPTLDGNLLSLRRAMQEMVSNGVTSLQDAFATADSMAAFAALADKGELKPRVKACLGWSFNISGVDKPFEAVYAQRGIYSRDRLKADCVKIVGDGVPGEGHTAAMLEPYEEVLPGEKDDSRKFGILNVPPDVMKKMVARFDADGMSMLIHCTGDRCARAAVDSIEAARQTNGYNGLLHQVGHDNFTTLNDLQKGKTLGATFEFSAYLYYLNGVTTVYRRAIGTKRFERYKPLRDTIDSGAIALEGSDWPVSPSADPWTAIETLVTRQKPGGGGEKLAPGQAITLKEVIDIYTVNGAKQWGHAYDVGKIKPGYLADVIVLSQNPFKVPITDVHNTKVMMTFINGEQVFAR